MTPEMKSKLKKILINHEGYEKFPYVDTVGKITIGIGYNLTDRGISDAWINQQYEEDVNYFYESLLNEFHWFKDLNEARQLVLIDMAFMGLKTLKSFKRMLAALACHNYEEAARQMLDSKWAAQVHGRANELAAMMVSGKLLGE